MQPLPRYTLAIAVTLAKTFVDASMDGFACDKTRITGYADHRTLNLPAAWWDSASPSDREWAEKLCCVFTWVARDSSTSVPYMITFDGGRRNYADASTFAAAAQKAYSAVCAMSMGSQDCASEKQRCPATRKYEAVGQLCRPKNNDGYAVSTQVVSASACRAKCEADASRCGAFEYEYVAGDDRECELHEKGTLDRAATAAMGACKLTTTGGDPLLDPPVFGEYRCCWIVNGTATGVPAMSGATTMTTTTTLTIALVSLSLLRSTTSEESFTKTTTTKNVRYSAAASSSSLMTSCKYVTLLVLLAVCVYC